jgi:hypothetical protein
MVPDREILALLGEVGDLDRAARTLVDAANAGGGEDNITVVLFALDGDADTVTMPAVTSDQEHDGDEEDTLSGLDPVPAVDTAVVPADEIRDHLRRQEPEPKRSLVPLLVLAALLIVLVALAIWGLTR